MFVVGVTGGIGSGKTSVTNVFQSLDIHVVDADIVAREAVQQNTPALAAIAEHFGNGVLLASGELDRTALRKIIFNNNQEKSWLESLLHPIIRKEIKHQLTAASGVYVILSSPLLIESKQDAMTNRVLVVDAKPETQLERASARDNSSHEEIAKIIDSQMPRDQRLKYADDVIDNNGTNAETTAQVMQLHQQYLTLSKT